MPPTMTDIHAFLADNQRTLPAQNGKLIPFYIPARYKRIARYVPLAMRGKILPFVSMIANSLE